MMQIDIASLPNQQMSAQLGGAFYQIVLKAAPGCVSATVTRDNVAIVSGQRVVAGEPIIPYRYLEDGNLAITTLNDEVPDWTQFGSTQFLVYASVEELRGLRDG